VRQRKSKKNIQGGLNGGDGKVRKPLGGICRKRNQRTDAKKRRSPHAGSGIKKLLRGRVQKERGVLSERDPAGQGFHPDDHEKKKKDPQEGG